MRREPRLQFTKEEQESPALEKTIRKADRAAARADKVQAKVPKRKVKQRTVDPETGTVTVRLQFEAKKPPSKLQPTLRDAPADTALGAVHREVRQSEADNVGLESAHKTERAAESAGRLVRAGYRSHKLRPYRKAAAAERKLGKANVNALYQKSLQENPVLSSNPLSRWQQKQAIKRQYAAATVGQTATNTARSAKTAAKKSRQAADFARRHKKGFLVRRALTRTTTNFKDRQVLRRQHLPVPLCTFRGTHVPNHANVRVVDLHSLPRMFGPLHILLMHHDFLNEQPQQFRRQFLDVGVAPGF